MQVQRVRSFISDWEGPFGKNDYAMEISDHFLPNGALIFTLLSNTVLIAVQNAMLVLMPVVGGLIFFTGSRQGISCWLNRNSALEAEELFKRPLHLYTRALISAWLLRNSW